MSNSWSFLFGFLTACLVVMLYREYCGHRAAPAGLPAILPAPPAAQEPATHFDRAGRPYWRPNHQSPYSPDASELPAPTFGPYRRACP
jgi:hypothetical protein